MSAYKNLGPISFIGGAGLWEIYSTENYWLFHFSQPNFKKVIQDIVKVYNEKIFGYPILSVYSEIDKGGSHVQTAHNYSAILLDKKNGSLFPFSRILQEPSIEEFCQMVSALIISMEKVGNSGLKYGEEIEIFDTLFIDICDPSLTNNRPIFHLLLPQIIDTQARTPRKLNTTENAIGISGILRQLEKWENKIQQKFNNLSSNIHLQLISILINKLLKSKSLQQISQQLVYFRNLYAKIINPPKIIHRSSNQTQKLRSGITFHRKIPKKGSEYSQSQQNLCSSKFEQNTLPIREKQSNGLHFSLQKKSKTVHSDTHLKLSRFNKSGRKKTSKTTRRQLCSHSLHVDMKIKLRNQSIKQNLLTQTGFRKTANKFNKFCNTTNFSSFQAWKTVKAYEQKKGKQISRQTRLSAKNSAQNFLTESLQKEKSVINYPDQRLKSSSRKQKKCEKSTKNVAQSHQKEKLKELMKKRKCINEQVQLELNEKIEKKMKRESISSKNFIDITNNTNSLLNDQIPKPKTIQRNFDDPTDSKRQKTELLLIKSQESDNIPAKQHKQIHHSTKMTSKINYQPCQNDNDEIEEVILTSKPASPILQKSVSTKKIEKEVSQKQKIVNQTVQDEMLLSKKKMSIYNYIGMAVTNTPKYIQPLKDESIFWQLPAFLLYKQFYFKRCSITESMRSKLSSQINQKEIKQLETENQMAKSCLISLLKSVLKKLKKFISDEDQNIYIRKFINLDYSVENYHSFLYGTVENYITAINSLRVKKISKRSSAQQKIHHYELLMSYEIQIIDAYLICKQNQVDIQLRQSLNLENPESKSVSEYYEKRKRDYSRICGV